MNQKHLNITVNGGLTRRATFDGKEYLVVPVVMIRQQVMNGELVLASEFGPFSQAWNGTPAVINHPQERGTFISANSPEVLELNAVGQVFNTRLVDNSLKAEIWIDVNKATLLGGEAYEAYQRLDAGEIVNVSTAYFCEVEQRSGTYEGRTYSGVQRAPFPDHLAILPNMDGACNIADGCGAGRFNQRQEEARVKDQPKQGLMARFKAFLSGSKGAPTVNEGESYNERRVALDNALTEVVGDRYNFYIVDMFDDAVIYETFSDDGMFRRSYSLNDDLEVTLGDPEEVVQRVSYETKGAEPISANEATDQAAEAQEPEAPEDPPAEPPEVAEADPGAEPVDPPEPTKPAQPETPTANAKPCGCDDAAPERSNVKDKTPAPKQNAKTQEEFLAEMPDGDAKSFITNGIKAHAKHRTQLIEGLKTNERCIFDEATLTVMQTEQLEQLTEMLAPADYSGVTPPRANARTEEDDKPLVLNSVAARLPQKQEAAQA